MADKTQLLKVNENALDNLLPIPNSGCTYAFIHIL